MWNLFNKKANIATQKKLVAKIHEEFDTAQDRLIEEANRILSEKQLEAIQQVEEKAKRLKALGFTNTSEVGVASKIQEKRKEDEFIITKTKEEAETIRHYQQEYPFLKFITESELERICTKYGLIFAPVSNYIMDVPNKNLKEIEQAPALKGNDKRSPISKYKITKDHHIKDNCPKHIKKQLLEGFEMKRLRYSLRDRDINEHFKMDKDITNWSPDYEEEKIDKDGLFIAAPPSHFSNLGKLKRKTQHGFFNTTTFVKEDPIVFRYVKGGIQIITKWGLEAGDSLILNPIDN